MVDSHYYDYVVKGMRMAVTGGTCRIGAIPGIEVCGKTGTAQNPHGKDHSAFMGFAPMDNPKIAIAVYVECRIRSYVWCTYRKSDDGDVSEPEDCTGAEILGRTYVAI